MLYAICCILYAICHTQYVSLTLYAVHRTQYSTVHHRPHFIRYRYIMSHPLYSVRRTDVLCRTSYAICSTPNVVGTLYIQVSNAMCMCKSALIPGVRPFFFPHKSQVVRGHCPMLSQLSVYSVTNVGFLLAY
jgi:hypothetical protein